MSLRTNAQAAKDKKMSLTEFSKTYKPFRYPWAVDLAMVHEQVHWIEDEVDLSDDVADWKSEKRMTKADKNFVTQILRLFTQSDVAVGQNYYDFFIPVFKNNEIRNMLGSFAAREAVHQRAYALLNDTLGLPEAEWSAFLEYKEMADKVEFMRDNDNHSQKNIALSLAKSVFSEGVSLFASFAMLLNYERMGKMKGMCKVVEWSIRDESMHVEGISSLFRAFCEEHPRIVNDEFKATIYQMARDVVKLEDKFIDLAYEMGGPENLKKEDVKTYIRHITDRRLLQLGLKPNFGQVDNPIPWINNLIAGAGHTNFFEARVTDYEVAGLKGDWKTAIDAYTYKVISIPDCPFCEKTFDLLKENGLPFMKQKIFSQEEKDYMKQWHDRKSFPIILAGDAVIGGYDDLKAMLDRGAKVIVSN